MGRWGNIPERPVKARGRSRRNAEARRSPSSFGHVRSHLPRGSEARPRRALRRLARKWAEGQGAGPKAQRLDKSAGYKASVSDGRRRRRGNKAGSCAQLSFRDLFAAMAVRSSFSRLLQQAGSPLRVPRKLSHSVAIIGAPFSRGQVGGRRGQGIVRSTDLSVRECERETAEVWGWGERERERERRPLALSPAGVGGWVGGGAADLRLPQPA